MGNSLGSSGWEFHTDHKGWSDPRSEPSDSASCAMQQKSKNVIKLKHISVEFTLSEITTIVWECGRQAARINFPIQIASIFTVLWLYYQSRITVVPHCLRITQTPLAPVIRGDTENKWLEYEVIFLSSCSELRQGIILTVLSCCLITETKNFLQNSQALWHYQMNDHIRTWSRLQS